LNEEIKNQNPRKSRKRRSLRFHVEIFLLVWEGSSSAAWSAAWLGFNMRLRLHRKNYRNLKPLLLRGKSPLIRQAIRSSLIQSNALAA